MRPLSAAQVPALWDAGQTRHPIDRALLALALAMPEEAAPDELADRPVGWREVNLLALRNATFGSALDGYAPAESLQDDGARAGVDRLDAADTGADAYQQFVRSGLRAAKPARKGPRARVGNGD